MAPQEINELRGYLTYRLESMKAASEYKNIMGLDFVDCNEFDFESWVRSARNVAGEKTARGTNEKWLKYLSFRYIIVDCDLFSKPIADQGWEYTKPYEYLAAACVECELDEETVKMLVSKVLAGKLSLHLGAHYRYLLVCYRKEGSGRGSYDEST